MVNATINKAYIGGRATSKDCPRGGHIWLRNGVDETPLVMETRCKTWRCKGCRDRVLAMVRMKIQYGCSILKHSWLITVTYAAGRGRILKDAECVKKDWTQFLYQLRKRARYRELAWFRVLELTKRKQIHLHLIVGGLGGIVTSNCEYHYPKPGHTYDARWRVKDCDCLEHEWSRLWHEVTGDSYVVDARPVLGAAGAASYVGKYLLKAMGDRDEMERRGFKRRYSCSRSWPGDQLQLKGTVEKRWLEPEWYPKNQLGNEYAERTKPNDPRLVRTGTDLALALGGSIKRKQRRALIERIRR